MFINDLIVNNTKIEIKRIENDIDRNQINNEK